MSLSKLARRLLFDRRKTSITPLVERRGRTVTGAQAQQRMNESIDRFARAVERRCASK